jgi:hypothetical protein
MDSFDRLRTGSFDELPSMGSGQPRDKPEEETIFRLNKKIA